LDFNIWRTIKLGTGLKTNDDFWYALHNKGFACSADIIFKPFMVATQETEVDLVKVTAVELGFRNEVRREQIYQRARELGLELCPAEVGPQLRLQYRNQPKEESIIVAMEPIINTDSDGAPYLFMVDGAGRHNAIRGQLNAIRGNIDFDPTETWVFVRPRK
jgi:hypothetical protein